MEDFEKEVKAAASIAEVFEVCNKYYKTEEVLSFVNSTVVKAGIINAIKIIKPKKR